METFENYRKGNEFIGSRNPLNGCKSVERIAKSVERIAKSVERMEIRYN